VKDIAVPWFCADKDTYEQGDTVTVQGRVENRGNVTLRFDVNTWLADSSATRNLIMIPGGSTVVGYDPRQMPPGIYITGARAIATGDLVPGNNSASDTFVVRGPIDHDYAVLKILEPTGIKDTLTPIAPSTIIKNQGTQPDMAMVFFRIAGPDDSIVMFDSSYHMLAPGDSTPATFPEIRFSKFGRYTSACSVHMAGDQNNLNDKKVDTFEVAAVGVVADPKPAPARAFSLAPNPACDLVMVNLGPVSAPAEVSVYDVTGSAVRPSFVISTSSLRLDVRSMPPGLYFVRAASASRTQTAKLVVER
jgi:hypothetical protein